MIDVTHQISVVGRKVGSRMLEAGEARIVTVSQTYDADIDDVWDACTSTERIPRWLLPVSGDLRIHGRYQLEGNAGGRSNDATRRRALPPPGSTAGTSAGSSSGCRPTRRAARGSSWSTPLTSTTTGGPSSGREPSGWAGTWR